MQILPERRQPNDQTHPRGRLPPGQPLLRPGPGPGRPAAAGTAGAPLPPGPACPGAGGRPGAPLRRPAGRAADLPGDRPGPGPDPGGDSMPGAHCPGQPRPLYGQVPVCRPGLAGQRPYFFHRGPAVCGISGAQVRGLGERLHLPPPGGRPPGGLPGPGTGGVDQAGGSPWGGGGQGGLRPHLQSLHRRKRPGLSGPGPHPPI